jgi:hypothetical protein
MATQKQISEQLEGLAKLLAGQPTGLLIEELDAKSNLKLTRRTLQRRLDALIEAGRIKTSEQGKATRYIAVAPAVPERPAVEPEAIAREPAIPLSNPSLDILRLVQRPREARVPVGYNRAFLDSYRPNVTSYLSDAEKTKLAELGTTVMPAEPAGTYAQHILNRLLIDLSWNSSRLEGNTYSLLDTERLIDLGEEAEGKNASDAQMILNHKAAIEFLVQDATDITFDRRTILNLHALLADNLLGNPDAAGRLRTIMVGIGQSVFLPLNVPQLIEECFDQILATARAITNPFEQAFFFMVQLPYLQPFDDVNKRVSRLGANIPLIRRNLSPLSFIDVPDTLYTQSMLGVYELNRVDLIKDVFLWAYERSAQRYAAVRQTLGEPDALRLRHRLGLKTVVADVIKAELDKKQAAKHIATWTAENIPESDRQKFIEIAETELSALHEGSFARYRVTPREFDAWHKIWNAKSPAKPKPVLNTSKHKGRGVK